ncbi:ribonuclease H-like domain-containing protein [Tanacetum coccineum]|uniref:Ribonuclease H-like domain-containing protein n=1 Tax=Tanacetum coccineum TaxID=301880 RepID=A0ABQ5I3G5_9ASTR
MDLENTQSNAVAKFPLLIQGDYEMWKLRIEQYFQIQDYALWDVIENGNSFKPEPRVTANEDGTSTSSLPGPVTNEEKIQKKNDVKARSMLLMALPNEHLLTFSQYKEAKTLFEAIQARFGGNNATRKTQKTLLKQMYKNFNASSTESLDSIFNRLQKIVSQLAILGEIISQEDLNLKFLRSLPAEWNTHVVVWRNKTDLDNMSFDDLYNNFKIVEQEVKRSVPSSPSTQNMAFVSSPSSTNEVNTTGIQVSTDSTSVSTTSVIGNTANLSDATVYAFLANQPHGSQLMHEDLEQIHEDDLEEMDLKWQLALLSMRARKYYQRTGKKITINGSDTAGYDKRKVECFNCHKLGHFAREFDWVAIDGAGFDWSFMEDEELPTNMALMAFSDSEVLKTCSNSCLKKYETLKNQHDTLRVEYNKTEFDLANYKRGLASVEEQLAFYKKNEILFCEQIAVLKRDASFRESDVTALKAQIEKLKKEKEGNKIKIDNFENASKSLDKLIGSQLADNNRKGLGFDSYNAVAPPPIGLFVPPSIDLSNSGLKEFQEPENKGYGVKKSVTENTFEFISSGPIIEDWVSDCDKIEFKEKVEKDECNKPKTEQANEPRKDSQIPKIKRTKLNEKPTSKPGIGFQVTKRACFVCGSLGHLIKDCDYHEKRMATKCVNNKKEEKGTGSGVDKLVWNNVQRLNHQNQFVPRAVLTRTGKILVNTTRTNSTNHDSTARQNPKSQAVLTSGAKKVNTVRPKVNENRPKPVFNKTHSSFRRPFHQRTAPKNRNMNNKVSTANVKLVSTASVNSVSTANVKLVSAVNIKSVNGQRVVSAVGKQGDNVVKPSAYWIWRPIGKVIDHGDPQVALKDTGIFDSGCSRHMTGNKSYLSDYQEFDGGFVAFGGSSKGGKISSKGTIRTGKLDFEDVYFVKELKFNLFSVSQMCDRKNNVLFTETECLILSPEFKLPDENQVMLKIPRKDNMYSFDLKNVVPTNGLTCLFAKATNDESKL